MNDTSRKDFVDPRTPALDPETFRGFLRARLTVDGRLTAENADYAINHAVAILTEAMETADQAPAASEQPDHWQQCYVGTRLCEHDPAGDDNNDTRTSAPANRSKIWMTDEAVLHRDTVTGQVFDHQPDEEYPGLPDNAVRLVPHHRTGGATQLSEAQRTEERP